MLQRPVNCLDSEHIEVKTKGYGVKLGLMMGMICLSKVWNCVTETCRV